MERQQRGLVALEELRSKPPEHQLTDDLAALVIAHGFGAAAESAYWRKAMLEAVDDRGLTAEQVGEIFRRWHQSQPSVRPAKSRLWYLGGKGGRLAREFIDRALGVQPRANGVAFAMDGGLGS